MSLISIVKDWLSGTAEPKRVVAVQPTGKVLMVFVPTGTFSTETSTYIVGYKYFVREGNTTLLNKVLAWREQGKVTVVG